MSFRIFWNEKTHFQGIKTRSSKSRKVAIFVKGLTHGFGTKMAIFAASFFFGKIGQENVFFDILHRKNAFLGYKNKKIEKSKNCHFSEGVNPWFWSKNGHFFNFSYLGNIDQENVFYDILERKNAFLGYKNKKLKKSKNCDDSKGVNPWFLYKKWPFFQLPFARQYRPEKRLCFRYSRSKNARLGQKKRSSKSRKMTIFPKRLTHGFGPKMTIFSTSFFYAVEARTMCFAIFQNEKRLSRL